MIIWMKDIAFDTRALEWKFVVDKAMRYELGSVVLKRDQCVDCLLSMLIILLSLYS